MKKGRFGDFGGQFVSESLMEALSELEKAFTRFGSDPAFVSALDSYLAEFAGRPTPLTFCRNLSQDLGFRVYLKREDLLHGGAHKLNNTLGQALLAQYMGKKRLIAETGAGQHGVATAIAGAVLGLPVEVYMGEVDIARQRPNVFRMELMGAEVIPVSSGTRTLKDAVNEALRDWAASVGETHYLLGSVVGPHPFPLMVRTFQAVIGKETRSQILEKEGRLPDAILACVGGGSNAIGIFHPFLEDKVRLIGVEAGGEGIESGRHGASLCAGSRGSSTGRSPTSSRTGMDRSSPPIASQPASIIQEWGRSTRCSVIAGGSSIPPSLTGRLSKPSPCSPVRRGLSRHSSPPTPSPNSQS